MFAAQRRMYLAAFLVDAAVMVAMTATPFFVFNQLGGGAAMSGLFGAVSAAGYACMCLVSSRFVSRAKHGLRWAYFGLTLYTVLICLMPVFRRPVVCGALAGGANVGMAFVWPALHSWIGAETDLARRGRRMARFNVAWSFGFAVSALCAGPLYDLDYRYPFVLLFALSAAALALLWSLPREVDHFGEATEEMLLARADHDRASEVHLYAAWFANLVGMALAAATRTVYPKRIDELVAAGRLRLLFESDPLQILTGGAATKYSWLAFVLAGACTLMFLVLGRTRRWQHRFRYVLGLQAASGLAFWTLANTESLVVMLACFAVVGANNGLAFFAAVYYSVADPSRKHRRTAVNEAAVGVGAFSGSIAFGLLAKRYGLAMPFRYAPLLIAAAIAIQFLLLRYGTQRQRRDARSQAP